MSTARNGAPHVPHFKSTKGKCAPRFDSSRLSQAARRIAFQQQVERWERLLQLEHDLETSTALYFSGAQHPVRHQSDFDWLQELVNGGEILSRQMADCVDRLSTLQECR